MEKQRHKGNRSCAKCHRESMAGSKLSRLLTLCSFSRMYYVLCVSFIPQITNWSTLESPVSSFSIQKAELCGHALHISWVKEKLGPCSQGKAHNDPKAQAGTGTATVVVPQKLKCSALPCTQKGCTQASNHLQVSRWTSTAQHSHTETSMDSLHQHRRLSLLLLSAKPVLLS